jgi:hypothetical protein
LDLFAKQTRVKGDGGKCGNGKDGTIRITIQNVFIEIAEFGQERDIVTRRSGGYRCRSMQAAGPQIILPGNAVMLLIFHLKHVAAPMTTSLFSSEKCEWITPIFRGILIVSLEQELHFQPADSPLRNSEGRKYHSRRTESNARVESAQPKQSNAERGSSGNQKPQKLSGERMKVGEDNAALSV